MAKVEIDGVDVSRWCTGYTLTTHGVHKPPQVSVTLMPDELMFEAQGADVAAVRAVVARTRVKTT